MEMTFRFVEDLIEDVITVNQYYNSKLTSIQEEFTILNTIVYEDILRVALCLRSNNQKPSLFKRNRRNPEILKRINTLLGEMLLLQYFSFINYNGIRKVEERLSLHRRSSRNTLK